MIALQIIRGFPPAKDGFAIAAEAVPANPRLKGPGTPQESFVNSAMREKIVFVSLLGIIFANMLPGVRATSLQIAVATAFIIIVNTALSQWLARSGTHWKSIIWEFMFMTFANFLTVLAYFFLLSRYEGSLNLVNTLFFILLLTLNVTLYDRYRQVYRERHRA